MSAPPIRPELLILFGHTWVEPTARRYAPRPPLNPKLYHGVPDNVVSITEYSVGEFAFYDRLGATVIHPLFRTRDYAEALAFCIEYAATKGIRL